MERSGLNGRHTQVTQTRTHLGSRLGGVRQRENVVGRVAPTGNRVGDAVGDRPCFTRAGARENTQWRANGLGDLALLGVETLEDALGTSHLRSAHASSPFLHAAIIE